ncbi:MAG TPA: hypothetical protein VHX38_20180 [Pseudonocardiaceae bacterium]|jgi:hypothetical protein|nr:hypothetical protein [Pseudonocardiaceae bacterium]
MQHRSNSIAYIPTPPSRSWHTGIDELSDLTDRISEVWQDGRKVSAGRTEPIPAH